MAWAQERVLVSSDRYLMKILDRTVSSQDITYQVRNLKALNCIYDDAFVIQYFGRDFIKSMNSFISGLPKTETELRPYLHKQEKLLVQIRTFFKMLRYSEDQKAKVSPELEKLLRQSTKENNCESEVLYKDTLKTNFITLMQVELYLRTRYGGQLKNSNFESVKPSIDLFIESLDKQFGHEYYW